MSNDTTRIQSSRCTLAIEARARTACARCRTPPVADRGMPDLGQLPRSSAGMWLTPSRCGRGRRWRVWTVHGFLARH